MPYQISQDSRLIRLTYAGYVGCDDVLNSAHAIIVHESQYAHRPDQLTDRTGITQSETGYDVLMPVGIERRARTFSNTLGMRLWRQPNCRLDWRACSRALTATRRSISRSSGP